MNRSGKVITLVLWLLVLCGVVASAQKRYSEEEINAERKFLEAYEKKIIGKYDEAVALYEELLRTDPGSHAAAFELARIFDIQGKTEDALRMMKMATGLDPGNAFYQEFLADILQRAGRFSEAADQYARLVGGDPNNDYFYYRWAYFLVRANEIARAIKVYDDFEKRIGINEELARRKHNLYLGMGDNKKAARELERLIEAFPRDMEYRHLLAGFFLQIGEQQMAEKIYQDILAIEPNNARAMMALAGNTPGASSDLYYLESLRPAFEQADVDIDLKIAKILPFINKVAETGDAQLADAVLTLTGVLEHVHPDEAKPLSAAGDLLYYSSRKAQALEKYLQTLDKDETVYAVWEQACRIYAEEGDYQALRRKSGEAMDLFPNKAFLYYLNGMAYLELNDAEAALDVLDQAALMAGNDAALKRMILPRLGQAYAEIRQWQDASAAFAEALRGNPDDVPALALYSQALSGAEAQHDKAREMADRALRLAPGYAPALQAMSRLFYKDQDWRTAREWMEKALAAGADRSPASLEYYGDLLYQAGEVENALRYWIMAREKGNRSRVLERKINDRKWYE